MRKPSRKASASGSTPSQERATSQPGSATATASASFNSHSRATSRGARSARDIPENIARRT